MSNFSINGVSKSWTRIARDWSLPAFAPRNRMLLKIPGRPGAIVTESETDIRSFPLPIIIIASTMKERLERIEELSSFILSDKPQEWKFDKYPNRTLYAMIDGGMDIDEMYEIGEGKLNVICPDPYKYGPSKILPFVDGAVTVHNNGTIDVSPVIEATVLEDITYLDVFNNDGYMRIGAPVEAGQVSVEREQRVLWEQMDTLTGWSATGTAVDGGVIDGTFTTNGYDFVATYGTGTSWHGPALKKPVPNAPLTDFKLEFLIKFPSVSGSFGRQELYLLDDQSQIVAKVGMKKVGGGASGNIVEIRLGDLTTNHFLVNYAGDSGRSWNDFNGILRLTRIGNVWEAYVAMIDQTTGLHHTRHTARYTDSGNLFARNLSQVQIHMAQNGTTPVPDLRIRDVKVYKINEIPDTSPYVIARAGDIIKFDHKRSEITINGEDKKVLKDMGALRFFKLPKGEDVLLIEPKDKVTATVKIEEGYL